MSAIAFEAALRRFGEADVSLGSGNLDRAFCPTNSLGPVPTFGVGGRQGGQRSRVQVLRDGAGVGREVDGPSAVSQLGLRTGGQQPRDAAQRRGVGFHTPQSLAIPFDGLIVALKSNQGVAKPYEDRARFLGELEGRSVLRDGFFILAGAAEVIR